MADSLFASRALAVLSPLPEVPVVAVGSSIASVAVGFSIAASVAVGSSITVPVVAVGSSIVVAVVAVGTATGVAVGVSPPHPARPNTPSPTNNVVNIPVLTLSIFI